MGREVLKVKTELDKIPFFIDHGNLLAQNIIVNSDYNIIDIIDWGFDSYQLFQVAASLSQFLMIEHSLDLELCLMLQMNHTFFLEALQCELLNSSAIVPLLIKLYSAPDVDYRRLILEVIISKGRHKWFADRSWLCSDTMVDVEHEVSEFFKRESSWSSGLDITDVTNCLRVDHNINGL
ncbi:hypothetical protein AJ79_09792 [Helicocarpus griseus UAMH5409]|uniref:Aminoglycoside phosphotransferase domain-containing protein n=1 Tax=Helicocarpus griseus UAMH5409 TaxID=1447875 RepID=A0A2B7WHB1_9EURO|nr:hypothetical protein AJ79_09792 [Helicocarpus griseus UAMH5409]